MKVDITIVDIVFFDFPLFCLQNYSGKESVHGKKAKA